MLEMLSDAITSSYYPNKVKVLKVLPNGIDLLT